MCCLARDARVHLAESGELGGCVSGQQQKVSLFHRRHERFSRRFPSSMASEILLKTASGPCQHQTTTISKGKRISENIPDHMPNNCSTDRVSMVCILSTSILTNECSGRKGMAADLGQQKMLLVLKDW